ncbi:hypothetical protein [Sphingobacterium siyangense]|uniref:hypothetical protein n=1 Tax=Sphingobacterium siyangense TaxID=459529 RepID=UPI002FD9B04E
MKNEKETNRIEGGPAGRKTKTALSADFGLYSGYKEKKGCTAGGSRKKAVRSRSSSPHDFLNQVFMPAVDEGMTMKAPLQITSEMNIEFKFSLALVKQYYRVNFPDCCTGQFAYDWLVDINKLSTLIGAGPDMEINIIRTDSGKIVLETKECFSTGACLYYMPVMPLYRFIKNKRYKSSRSAVMTLLSTCSYLYLIAGVPMYTDPSTYIFYEYEILSDWFDEGEDEGCKHTDQKEISDILAIGELMEQKFFNAKNLKFFESRISKIEPKNEFDNYCLSIGKQALWLYQSFPEETIFRLRKQTDQNPYEYDYMTRMDQYISFTGTSEGGVSDMLIDMVNNELSENSRTEEPEIIRVFDGSPVERTDLTFERAVFQLINDVCIVLNNY